MKFFNYIFRIILFGAAVLLLNVSCDDMEDKQHIQNSVTESSVTKIYVLSEGLFQMNNSTLAVYNFENQKMTTDFFTSANNRGLGDTANDIEQYGSKLYIVVNVSSDVEIIDASTGKSLKQISMFDDNGVARQPRYVDFYKGNAYVCSFDGTLARIDTTSMEINGIIKLGRNPDGICVANGKVYVTNSGGLDYPGYDNTVSVVDPDSFTEIKKITVGLNPYKIHADSEGDVYLISRGNYGDIPYKFQKINSVTDTLETSFDDIQALNFTIHKDTAYIYNYDYTTQTSWIKVFDCLNDVVISENFITDDTKLTTPYGIDVNPVNGDVYLTDAKSYTILGDVLCFSNKGELKFRLSEVGLNPNKVLFIKSD
ncbi:MAG: YncE family protein [Paludibacter sp.]|nr:YncE family protein [Paludibacter sp.]